MNGNKKRSYPAGFLLRFLAAIIDVMIWFITWFFLHEYLLIKGIKDPDIYHWIDKLILPVIFIYFVLAETAFGTTAGKCVFRIIVKKSNKNYNLNEALLRNTAKVISILPLLAGYALIGFRKDRKALHDLLTNTAVLVLANENEKNIN